MGAPAPKGAPVTTRHALARWSLPVVCAEDVGPRYRRLVVDAREHPIAEHFLVPGQYVTLRAPDDAEPRYFVIASDPHDLPRAEFLIARSAEREVGLVCCAAGTRIEASAPCGQGFGVAPENPADVVALVTGAGIAAVRPFLAARLRAAPELASRTRLFYGEAQPGAHAWRGELERWVDQGVSVTCLCDAGAGLPASERFVQEAWRAGERPGEAEQAHFLICGAPRMQEAACALLAARNVAEARIHFNG